MAEDDNKSDNDMEVAETEPANPELTKLQEELADVKNKYLYLRADLENYRKQVIKERSELMKFGSEPVLREFLTVLDDLDRASQVELKTESLDSYKNGVDLIVSQFKKVFDKFGVEEIHSLGQPFDPLIHEALGTVSSDKFPPGTVAEVFKKAYKLHGKVIRPAQVMVNAPPKGE